MVATTASVKGLIRDTVLSIPFATHTEPGPKVTARRRHLLVFEQQGRLGARSRVTLPSAGLVSHTEPAPKATPKGEEASGYVVTASVAKSTFVRLPAEALATHNDPSPAATPVGSGPTERVWTTWSVSRADLGQRPAYRVGHPYVTGPDTATAPAPAPMATVASTAALAGSIR